MKFVLTDSVLRQMALLYIHVLITFIDNVAHAQAISKQAYNRAVGSGNGGGR